jgi:hypothetical protein
MTLTQRTSENAPLPCILFSVVKTAVDAGATDRSSTSLGE